MKLDLTLEYRDSLSFKVLSASGKIIIVKAEISEWRDSLDIITFDSEGYQINESSVDLSVNEY